MAIKLKKLVGTLVCRYCEGLTLYTHPISAAFTYLYVNFSQALSQHSLLSTSIFAEQIIHRFKTFIAYQCMIYKGLHNANHYAQFVGLIFTIEVIPSHVETDSIVSLKSIHTHI